MISSLVSPMSGGGGTSHGFGGLGVFFALRACSLRSRDLVMAARKPDLDETTLQIMERMVHMPPKPHEDMKLGKRKASRASDASTRKRKSKARK